MLIFVVLRIVERPVEESVSLEAKLSQVSSVTFFVTSRKRDHCFKKRILFEAIWKTTKIACSLTIESAERLRFRR